MVIKGVAIMNFSLMKNKKIISFFIIIIFLIPTSSILALHNDVLNISNQYSTPTYDQLDQSQYDYSMNETSGYASQKIYYNDSDHFQWASQSFTPSLPILTRVRLWLYNIRL